MAPFASIVQGLEKAGEKFPNLGNRSWNYFFAVVAFRP